MNIKKWEYMMLDNLKFYYEVSRFAPLFSHNVACMCGSEYELYISGVFLAEIWFLHSSIFYTDPTNDSLL